MTENVMKYVRKFKEPEECYMSSCKLTHEALEQIQANIKCIQNIFQDPNYQAALYMMGVHASIEVTLSGEKVIVASFGVADESISASTESTG